MTIPVLPQKNKRKKSLLFLVPLLITFISAAIYFYPALKKAPAINDTALIIDGQKLPEKVIIENEEILLPGDIIKEKLDKNFYYDSISKIAIVTTKDKVLEMATNSLTGYLNSEEIKINTPMREKNGSLYIPIEVLAPLYNLDIKHYDSANSVVIHKQNKPFQKALITSNFTFLRTEPTLRSSIITRLQAGEEITVYAEKNNWLKILTSEGVLGYIKDSKAQFIEATPIPYQKKDTYLPWDQLGEKINLTWDNIYSYPSSFHKAPPITGVNVLSPSWFHLTTDGSIKNMAYKPYVDWAHESNYQVWALFSNSFDPDLTHEILADPEKRKKIRNQLLVLAELYNLDGINIDFENMYYADKDLFVQFIREITPFLHEMDLTVSLDVTVLSQSKRWSLVYDRESLAETVDYMMVMAYDQYPQSSTVAGPVSSLYWTENKLQELLEIIPPEKTVLGIPFYTRLWREQNTANGKKITSQAISMQNAQKLLQEQNLEPTLDAKTGLMYAEYTEGDSKYKIWLETENSIQKRVELVKKYNLAGIASWRRGFETPEIWNVIKKQLEKQP